VPSPADSPYRRIGTSARVKRGMDVTLAGLGMLGLAPMLALIGAAVLVSSGRPVLFRQERAGRSGRPFSLLKFRTMHVDQSSTWDPANDAARLTTLGSFLRRWSLDELPQLINVLLGHMSLVGPRPLPMRYVARYSTEQARRLEVLPGITGWAQVNGRNTANWGKRFTLDVWYVDHWTLTLDVRILALTIRRVMGGDGISAEGQATMTEFMGG
jgi:sugar transferase EpsL